jgi:hypothetical protein
MDELDEILRDEEGFMARLDGGPAVAPRAPAPAPAPVARGPEIPQNERIFGSQIKYEIIPQFAQLTRMVNIARQRAPQCMQVHNAARDSDIDRFFTAMHDVAHTPSVRAAVGPQLVRLRHPEDPVNLVTDFVNVMTPFFTNGGRDEILVTRFTDLHNRRGIARFLINRMGGTRADRVEDFMTWLVALTIPALNGGIDRREIARQIARQWAHLALTAYVNENPDGTLDDAQFTRAYVEPVFLACPDGVMEGMALGLLRTLPVANDERAPRAELTHEDQLEAWFQEAYRGASLNPLGLTPEAWAAFLDTHIRALPADNNPANWAADIASYNRNQQVVDAFAGGRRRRKTRRRRGKMSYTSLSRKR